jgi:hypothetical protein
LARVALAHLEEEEKTAMNREPLLEEALHHVGGVVGRGLEGEEVGESCGGGGRHCMWDCLWCLWREIVRCAVVFLLWGPMCRECVNGASACYWLAVHRRARG